SSAPLAGSASGDRVALFRCYVSRFCVWAAADFSVHKRVMKVPVSAHPESDSRAIKRAPPPTEVRQELWVTVAMTFELFLIFLVVIAATTGLLSEVARLPAKKPKKKLLKRLLHSKPVPPKHQPPSPLKEGKEGITGGVQQFFADFEDFADVVNWWLADPHVAGPWRLQELPDAELSLDVSGSPPYGRRYAIFHNQERLGTLEVSDFFYRTEAPRVITRLRLDYVRLLSFDAVQNFLSAIALHTCDASPNSKGYSQA